MIKPIETIYKGYRMRSRLEGRWATFFDQIGISWEYESEGFDLDGEWYLPDFRLTSARNEGVVWVEIKPRGADKNSKFDAFARSLQDIDGHSAVMFCGDPCDVFFADDEKIPIEVCQAVDPLGDLTFISPFLCPRCGLPIHGGWSRFNVDELMAYCYPCDAATPSISETERGLLCVVTQHKGSILLDKEDAVRGLRKIRSAAVSARSARFEHGESGAARCY